jgi:hypothetical protein
MMAGGQVEYATLVYNVMGDPTEATVDPAALNKRILAERDEFLQACGRGGWVVYDIVVGARQDLRDQMKDQGRHREDGKGPLRLVLYEVQVSAWRPDPKGIKLDPDEPKVKETPEAGA